MAALDVFCLAAPMFYREFLGSGFDGIVGGPGDTESCPYLMEHWFQAFSGKAAAFSPASFHPQPCTLGYSYTFFFQGLTHSLTRLFTDDAHLAAQTALMASSLIGCVGFVVLFRSVRLHYPVALAFSVAATFLQPLATYLHGWMFFAYYLYPRAAVWILATYRANAGSKRLAAAAATGAILGTLFFSNWYFGFFLLLGLGVVSAILFGLSLHERLKSRAPRDKEHGATDRPAWTAVLIGAFTLLFLLPFFALYLPVNAARDGAGSFHDLRDFLPDWQSFLTYRGNWLYGNLAAALGASLKVKSEELIFAATAGLMASFPLGVLLLRRTGGLEPETRRVLFALGVVLLLIPVLFLVRWDGAPLWQFVWRWAPGAKAIRAPFRVMFLENFLLFLGLAVLLGALLGPRPSRLALFGATALTAFLVLEQVNLDSTHGLSRRRQAARFNDPVLIPPPECAAFYLVDPSAKNDPERSAAQVEAMLISQGRDVPTLNGYSANAPSGWNLRRLDAPWAVRAADVWMLEKGEKGPYCLFDRRTKRWSLIDKPAWPLYVPGEELPASEGFAPYAVRGVFPAEAGGVWTHAAGAEFALAFDPAPKGDLILELTMSALLRERKNPDPGGPAFVWDRRVFVEAGGAGAFFFHTNADKPTRHTIRLPHDRIDDSGLLRLTLRCEGRDSPATLSGGKSEDTRPLCLHLRSLRLVAAP